ncbi:HD domain-containing phosphohydrolase [Pseudoalteromonas ulvae]|uniref:Phosphohydrolase n=1 Tax=Pseudoalteromonas ulvae TaxID=107327 RepID=A0A244CQT0_PSEDV|nr:HD domain-containing phosphohydrolase [Pseudoalteromonas ulvae]OUL57846.1 phosphohydrolase [Pseudoalteromonas ulvae]
MPLLNNKDALDELLALSYRLSTEKNTTKLLEDILLSAKALTHADGGTIYSIVDGQELKFETLLNDSLNLYMGGTSQTAIPFKNIPIYLDGEINKNALVSLAAATQKPIIIEDAYQACDHDMSGARAMDQRIGYRTKSVLTVPMQNHDGDINGVLQLINAQYLGQVVPFNQQEIDLVLSMTSLAAVALTNKQLITEMEVLFESLAKVIARAIDEKSPYTGGHCRRVPELTMMIAEAVNRTHHGPLAEFHLCEQEKSALNVAGWLHDCGKIATPEYVMDKATKLQTIFDRIDYLDAKLEIYAQQLELKALKEPELNIDLASALEQLAADRDFLKHTNLGSEFLPNESIERIEHLAKTYVITINGVEQSVFTDDELACLKIQRGTLTPEERTIINHHIDVTVMMLDSLPFPKHLKSVPEYACGHHEKMDGTGYPKGLTKDQMSAPARMMAIADIFEALTASDRPYKPGKTLKECLTIMGFMAKDQHIDADLFNIFIKEKVYLDYAKKFVPNIADEDIDENDIPNYTAPY